MVLMSGDVDCCAVFVVTLVGVFWFKVMRLEFWMMSSICCPLWSVIVENHRFEWALKSPVTIRFGSGVSCRNVVVMLLSSVCWFCFVESLGGMYMLVRWYVCFFVACSLNICVSIWVWLVCVFISVKFMLVLTYVSNPPPVIVLSSLTAV